MSSRTKVRLKSSPGIRAGTRAQGVRLIKINEYKRRQAAVGASASRRAAWKGLGYPIASAWNEWEGYRCGPSGADR